MRSSPDDARRFRSATPAFLILSGALHALLLLGFATLWSTPAPIELQLPDAIELGVFELAPGAQGAPAPAAPPAPAPEVPRAPVPKPKPGPREAPTEPVADAGVVADAAVPVAADGAVAEASTSTSVGGEGVSATAGGVGLGFGTGGFGTGYGGAPGAVIGLHANLDAIRQNSLLLEFNAVLGVIPEWQKLLAGSGIDPLQSFSRVFVATPNLERASLVVSARFVGGEAFVDQAVQTMARARGRSAQFRSERGLRIAPWLNQGPTQRVVGLVAPDQLVIARPDDVGRVLSVSAALAQRQAKQPQMEPATGPAALLAMYEGEDAALSVEGARAFVVGDSSYVPQALRISLRHLDEFHAEVRVFGYYESAARAKSSVEAIDKLRRALAEHPKVMFLGLRSALDEATLSQQGDTLVLKASVTLHQLRYMMAFVQRALAMRR